jgi:hypothetical protein
MPTRRTRSRRRLTSSTEYIVLAIDSNYEPVTKAAFVYREKNVYPYFLECGLAVNKWQGTLARRSYVAPEAAKPEVDYLTGVGHGNYDMYTGHLGDPIFRIGHYQAEESRGKIVHFLSCQTGGQLGPDFVKHGCLAYFGYDENFTFHFEYSAIFFECDSDIDRGFADGLTARQVHARTRALYEKRISELLAQGSAYVAATLKFDLDHLRSPADGPSWGSQAAKLK